MGSIYKITNTVNGKVISVKPAMMPKQVEYAIISEAKAVNLSKTLLRNTVKTFSRMRFSMTASFQSSLTCLK